MRPLYLDNLILFGLDRIELTVFVVFYLFELSPLVQFDKSETRSVFVVAIIIVAVVVVVVVVSPTQVSLEFSLSPRITWLVFINKHVKTGKLKGREKEKAL